MSSRKKDKQELGQGIRALLNKQKDIPATPIPKRTILPDSVSKIPLDKIEVNPFQPRNGFEEQALQELAESIKIHGLIQPVTVRKLSKDKYQLISGERRCRASEIAGLKAIPAYVREADDQGMLEMALIENVQRENLNPIEIAISLQRLMDECNLTHDALSDRISKKRSTVTNYIRLLNLPPDIQTSVKDEIISMGHAKALLSLDDIAKQLLVFNQIKAKSLSVRATEKLVKNYKGDLKSKIKKLPHLPYEYREVQNNLSKRLDTKVNLQVAKNGKGSLTIHFGNTDQLNDLLDLLES